MKTSVKVGTWLEDLIVHRDDDPLRLDRGTAWSSEDLADMYNERHKDTINTKQVASALTWLRDNPHEFHFVIAYSRRARDDRMRWRFTDGKQ